VEIRRIANRTLAPSTYIWRELSGWGARSPDGVLTLLDDDLEDVVSFPLPADAAGVDGIARDGTAAVVSANARVVVIDRHGQEQWAFHHPSWGRGDSERGSCWFSADGVEVWAHVPTEDDPDEWVVLEARTGRLIARAPLQCYAAGSDPIRHPDGSFQGLSVGEGQDGSESYWGRLEDDRLVVHRLDDRSRVLIDVSPNGRWFLTTPHGDGPVQVHRVPDGDVVATLGPETVLDQDDGWDFFGGFFDDETIVLTSSDQDALVVARSPGLDAWETVPMPISRAGDGLRVAPGRILTAGWLDGVVDLWELVPPSS
jgi:hypothetical protein